MARSSMIVVLVVSTLMVLSFIPSVASAAGDWEISYEFSDNPINQEEELTVTWTFTNTADYQMEVLSLGINFDWMEANYYYFNPSSDDDPITLASDQNFMKTVSFTVDMDFADVGMHTYYFYVEYSLQDGLFGGWNDYDDQSSSKSDFRVLERLSLIHI